MTNLRMWFPFVWTAFMLLIGGAWADEPKCSQPGEWVFDRAVSDEFDAPSFDHGKWWDFTPWWRGRREYVNRAANVVQRDGCLELWAKRIPEAEQEYEDREQGFWPYTCGIVKSKAKVKYGYFEVRAKGTAAEVRNAFWLYDPLSDGIGRPWPKYARGSHSEEIDIYEFVGRFQDEAKKRPYQICAAVHRFETPYVEGVVNAYQTPLLHKNGAKDVDWRPSDGYHTYGLLWTPEEIVWYVDGEAYHRRPNDHYHTPLHVMIDVEIAKWRGAEPEKIDAATLPAVHSIDYFRYWKFAETPVATSFLKTDDVWVMSGDSITHNDYYRQVVLDALDHHHPGHGIRVMNTAVWGQLTSEAKGQGLDLRPTVATIMLGMNNVIHRDYPPTYDFADDAAKYAETIRAQVRGFREKGAAVVLMKPTYSDETEYSYFNVYHTRRGLEAYGRALERIAEEEDCAIIPVAEDFEEVKCRAGELDTFIADGVHPLGHGQYQIAKSLIERLNIAAPLGAKGSRRFVRQGPLPAAQATVVRGGNLLARRARVPLKVTSFVSGAAKLVWSARRGEEPTVVRGEQDVTLDGGAADVVLDLPDAAYPVRLGDASRLYVTLERAGETLATAIVDLGETKVFDLTSGSASGEVPGFGRWTVETKGRDLWVSGETYACAWPARPKNDTWMNSSGMNGLQTFFDFRPADRFAENRPDHDVSMINLNVLEEPRSVMAFSWIGRRTQNCLRTSAERTEKGFTWKLGFRGRVNDYTPFDISANDFFAMQLVFQVYDGKKWRHGPIMEQYRHGQPWIDPVFFLNVSPVFDRKGDLPKPTALTVSAWTL